MLLANNQGHKIWEILENVEAEPLARYREPFITFLFFIIAAMEEGDEGSLLAADQAVSISHGRQPARKEDWLKFLDDQQIPRLFLSQVLKDRLINELGQNDESIVALRAILSAFAEYSHENSITKKKG